MKTHVVRNALLGLLIVAGLSIPLAVGSQDRSPRALVEPEPQTPFSVALVVDGQQIALFSELVSLTSGFDIQDLELTAKKLKVPNSMAPPAIVLRRSKTSDLSIWQWHVAALTGANGSRRSVALIVYSSKGDPVYRYHLTDAWPAKVEIGALKAGASEVLMETVTMTCEQIQRVAV